MALTKQDIQIIKDIVNVNMQRYVMNKPYVLDMTYDELNREIVKIKETIPDIPVVRLE